MKAIVVIPSRYGSSRFPGKPLAIINGKSMIQRVYEQVKLARMVDEVIVATDHHDIITEVNNFKGNVIETSSEHESGSDRIEEAASKVRGDIYINVQGDEPLISPELIDDIIRVASENMESVITAKVKITEEQDIQDPNIVKVVTDKENNALYFSRSPIPYNRANSNITYFKHLGIYAYPKELLHQYVQLEKSELEFTEMLEQLRLLQNGINIKVIETSHAAIGVDVPEDIKKIEKLLEVK